MIAEIGHYCLVLALIIAVLGSILPLWGAWRHSTPLMQMAPRLAAAQFLLVALAFVVLCQAFVNNDFSIAYVAANSNSELPVHYRISAVWGAHEGSMLLWILILSGWMLAVALFSRSLTWTMRARVLGVISIISVGFLAFSLFTSNPFSRLLPYFPVDGRDLNPLLQDFGLIVHPPMLYMGYVGFVVPFAFAIAGLMQGRLDHVWARWCRPWTLTAWVFLTLGIALGSWWAYYELGWGGWWFWDPVENASFMPWLAGTALIHTLAVCEKRGAFRNWTVLLAIMTFSLSLLGTFLVRSGVLTSVHAFASDPLRGQFILAFLALVIGASLTLFAMRATRIQSRIEYGLVSREVALLLNNIFLAVVTLMVLIGTLYPLIAEAAGWGTVSVGPPYFNPMFGLFMFPLMALMALGQGLRWKHNDPAQVVKALWPWLVISLLAGLLLPLLAGGRWIWYLAVGIPLVSAIVGSLLYDLKSKARPGAGKTAGLTRLSRSYYGMLIAHLGLVVVVCGVLLTSALSIEKDVRLEEGQAASVGPYQFRLDRIRNLRGPNYLATRGEFRVLSDGEPVARLNPEKRRYNASGQVMTEAAIDPGLFRDLYVALGEPLGDGSWAVRVYYKPFVRWIWGGAILIALGGLLALTDRRYRLKVRSRLRTAVPGAEEARA